MKVTRNKRLLLAGAMALAIATFTTLPDKSDAFARRRIAIAYSWPHKDPAGAGCKRYTCPSWLYRAAGAPNEGVNWTTIYTCGYDDQNHLQEISKAKCAWANNGGCCTNLDPNPKCPTTSPPCPKTSTPPPVL